MIAKRLFAVVGDLASVWVHNLFEVSIVFSVDYIVPFCTTYPTFRAIRHRRVALS